jgi:hypothetical protein
MQFTFEGKTVVVDLEKMPLHEGLALQKATGHRITAFLNAVREGDYECLSALAWVIIKFRFDRPDVTFDDVCEGRVVASLDMFDGGEPDPPTSGEAKTPS